MTRHGKRPAVIQRAVVANSEPLPAVLVEGLVGRGLTFVAEVWQGYHGWTPSSSLLLREVGLVIDQLEALRGQEGERAAQRVLLALLGALRLEDA